MKLMYALLRKQRTHNLRYIVRSLLMKLAPGVQVVCDLVDVSELARVKSGIFGQTAKFGQRPCLFHISNIGIKNK